MLFSLIKFKKIDADDAKCKLRQKCVFHLAPISRLLSKGYAKTYFETLQTYNDEPDKTMSVCCYRCLKILIHYILKNFTLFKKCSLRYV